MSKQFHNLDRAGGAIANAVLKDCEVIDEQGTDSVIDRSALKCKRSKSRKKMREGSVLFVKMDGF